VALPYKPEYYFPRIINGLINTMIRHQINLGISIEFICELIRVNPDQKKIIKSVLYNNNARYAIFIYPIFDMIIGGEITCFSRDEIIDYLYYVSNCYYRILSNHIDKMCNGNPILLDGNNSSFYFLDIGKYKKELCEYKQKYTEGIKNIIYWLGVTTIYKSITCPWYYCFNYRVKIVIADECEKDINISKHYTYKPKITDLYHIDNVYIIKYLAYDKAVTIKFGTINTKIRNKPRIYHEEIIELNNTYKDNKYITHSMQKQIDQTIDVYLGRPIHIIGEL
jgi:hypothetical protein